MELKEFGLPGRKLGNLQAPVKEHALRNVPGKDAVRDVLLDVGLVLFKIGLDLADDHVLKGLDLLRGALVPALLQRAGGVRLMSLL